MTTTTGVIIMLAIILLFVFILTITTSSNLNSRVKKLEQRVRSLEYDRSLRYKVREKTLIEESKRTKEQREHHARVIKAAIKAIRDLENTENAYIAENLKRFKHRLLNSNSVTDCKQLETYQKFLINNNIIKDYYGDRNT